jgi:phage/plasmid-associated DNA primase
VFGPTLEIGKKALFEAWESWCMDEGQDPGSQVKFTRVMGERGVVKNFSEKKVNGTRVWRGISTENMPPNPKVPPEKPLQTGGSSNPRGHFSEDLTNIPSETLSRGGSHENEEKVPHVPPSDSGDEFTFDGLGEE